MNSQASEGNDIHHNLNADTEVFQSDCGIWLLQALEILTMWKTCIAPTGDCGKATCLSALPANPWCLLQIESLKTGSMTIPLPFDYVLATTHGHTRRHPEVSQTR
jgi:hypothetical protein